MALSPQSPSQNPHHLNRHISADTDEPVFQAPWEAHAFAIVHQLAADEHYSWPEWTEQLAAEIAVAEQHAPGEHAYYELWVNACEKLLAAKGIVELDAIEQKMTDILAERETEHHH